MNEKDIEIRMKLLNLLQKLEYSVNTRAKILLLFKNIKNTEKEYFAQKILKIVQNSKTEQEAMEQIMKLNQI